MKKALLIVDVQNDFLPGGNLAVKQGNEIIPLINALVHYPFDLIIATKDWHPSDHGSFAANHGKRTGEHVKLAGIDQILWPTHCVQGTRGAEFAPGWDTTCINKVIYKGTDPSIDSYSTFFDNGHLKSTGLETYLREQSIKDLYFAGLATDYCVKYSVLDALKLGFNPYVIADACRGVNLQPQDSQQALQLMQRAGAVLVSFKDLEGVMKEKENREL
ncbi:bifunctional nicotinamidase/pyrazinamidase [Candidatus Protochlamydia phocaeensis]|uniref:bifunctional nicotinamidase/pyrazinamidase n=1 Tax=Candidatus Protochlamydia phocaeensis TaxID=1414722 RepID=UPI000838CCD2|nr:bifunctional nicotinamidase/pyrazinamidase [Candidatus Protochlamydia phocaeensis]